MEYNYSLQQSNQDSLETNRLEETRVEDEHNVRGK